MMRSATMTRLKGKRGYIQDQSVLLSLTRHGMGIPSMHGLPTVHR